MIPLSKIDKNPTAVNILKLQRYNFKFFSLEEVIFFEYMVVKARAFGFKQFYHSHATITAETGIKRKKLERIICRFTELGIIEVEIKGFPLVHYYCVNFEKILDLISSIYQLGQMDKSLGHLYELLVAFYQPLAQKSQEKNIIKNSKEEVLKENEDFGSEWNQTKIKLFDFLSSLKFEKQFADERLVVDETELFRACKDYGADDILKRMGEYFEINKTGSVKKFLTRYAMNTSKIIFIEQQRAAEKEHVNNMLQLLDNIYNKRRARATRTERWFAETHLVINDNIRQLLFDCLTVKKDIEIENAFYAYTDEVIKGNIQVKKFLPYFFTIKYGTYSVIEHYQEYFNLNYSVANK